MDSNIISAQADVPEAGNNISTAKLVIGGTAIAAATGGLTYWLTARVYKRKLAERENALKLYQEQAKAQTDEISALRADLEQLKAQLVTKAVATAKS